MSRTWFPFLSLLVFSRCEISCFGTTTASDPNLSTGSKDPATAIKVDVETEFEDVSAVSAESAPSDPERSEDGLDRETSSDGGVVTEDSPNKLSKTEEIGEGEDRTEIQFGRDGSQEVVSSVPSPPPPPLSSDRQSRLDHTTLVVPPIEEPLSKESAQDNSAVESLDAATKLFGDTSSDSASGSISASFAKPSSNESFEFVVVASEEGVNASVGDAPVVAHDLDPTQSLLETGSSTATEDMPSFNEWAKKRLEEQGQRPQVPASQISKPPATLKKRHKNYASVDCGAKVLAANPEAQSSSAVLSPYKDDYMLNPCTAKIWLVVELCEAIQVDRLELANFELFSSSPKEFSVFSSDRYPSRDWNFLGTFEALDEKCTQSFTLHQTAFSKYVKVEMVSHYGAEHFCPLSLVRVYGTSEYEALETEEQAPDDASVHSGSSDDENWEADLVQGSTNLFGSAKDAVMTIVKKAAEVLRPGDDKSKNPVDSKNLSEGSDKFNHKNCVCLQRLPNVDCQGLEHVALSEHNSSLLEQSVSSLACNYDSLSALLRTVWAGERTGDYEEACPDACAFYLEGLPGARCRESSKCAFYRAVLGDERFGAFCLLDKLLLDQQRGIPVQQKFCPFSLLISSSVCATFVSPDISEIPISVSSHEFAASLDSNTQLLSPLLITPSATDASNSRTSVSRDEIIVSETSDSSGVSVSEIDPTRTVETGGGCGDKPQKVATDTGSSDVLDSGSCITETLTAESTDRSKADITPASYSLSPDKLSSVELPIEGNVSDVDVTTSSLWTTIVSRSASSASIVESSEVLSEASGHQEAASIASDAFSLASDGGQDALFLVEVEQDGASLSSFPLEATAASNATGRPVVLNGGFGGAPMSPGQKESVFVRLSNRIKALELNMSLSSQYLEELSCRYRKQMEEMQKAFNKTIGALNETARKAHERDLRQQEMIGLLQMQLDSLSKVVTQMAEQQENLHAQVIARHLVLMTIEVLVITVVFLACSRPSQRSRTRQIRSPAVSRTSPERVTDRGGAVGATPIRAIAGRPPERRNSDPTLVESSPSALLSERRRPSNEALNVSGTYSDLLIVEPTIPIWVDRCSPHKVETSKKSKRKKRSKGQGNGDVGLYRSLSNSSLSTRPPAHPPPSRLRKGSGSEVNSAGLLFVPSFIRCSRPENSRTAEKERGRDGKPPPLPRSLASECDGRRTSSSSNCSAPLCPLPSLLLSCNQPFSLKEANLTSSLVYCGSYDQSSMSKDPFTPRPESQSREKFRYENVGQKVYG